jgi:hypothetical protein
MSSTVGTSEAFPKFPRKRCVFTEGVRRGTLSRRPRVPTGRGSRLKSDEFWVRVPAGALAAGRAGGASSAVHSSVVAVLVGLLYAATGCAGDDGGMHGECSGRVRYDGTVYVPDSRLDQSLRAGRELGEVEVVDCDGKSVIDRVSVSRVRGEDSVLVVRVANGTWRGLYVDESVPLEQWPAGLAAPGG